MKKFLFSLICFISLIGVVSAKTQIAYDWGKYILPERLIDANTMGEDFGLLTYDPDDDRMVYSLYSKTGEQLIHKYVGDLYNVFLVNDQIVSFQLDYEEQKYYQYVVDKELNLVKKVQVNGYNFHNESKAGVTDKYYFIDEYIFDRKTNLEVNVVSYLNNHELADDYAKYYNEGNEAKASELYFNMVKDEFAGTYLAVDAFVYYKSQNTSWDGDNVGEYIYGEDGSFALLVYDYYNDKCFIEVYNSNYELITTLESKAVAKPQVLFRDNKFYVVEFILQEDSPDPDYEYYFKAIMTEYDKEGNKLEIFDLTSSLENRRYDGVRYDFREVFKILNTTNGFYVSTHKPVTPMVMDPTINEDDVMTNYYPTVQRFSFLYNVKVIENENGSLNVDKVVSRDGETIKYTVEAKEGYKVEKVIVTDEDGNKVEINGDTFIMPEADVTVEAIYIVINPNTAEFIIGVILVFLIGIAGFVALKSSRIKQYE